MSPLDLENWDFLAIHRAFCCCVSSLSGFYTAARCDDPHDTADTPTPASKFGGKEKTMMMDKTIYDNQDEDMKSQVTRLCSRASKSPKISLCNNCY